MIGRRAEICKGVIGAVELPLPLFWDRHPMLGELPQLGRLKSNSQLPHTKTTVTQEAAGYWRRTESMCWANIRPWFMVASRISSP